MLLTAELLLYYQRCNRRAFLDVYGDRRQQDPQSDYLEKLMRDGFAHRKTVLSQYDSSSPVYPPEDWQAGFEATLALMRQGVDCIHRGVLLSSTATISEIATPGAVSGVTLLSLPDLLVKSSGQSSFGDWVYLPVAIKLGKRPKLDYQIVAAFHALLLFSVQGAMPETSYLALRDSRRYAVNLHKVLPQLEQALQGCVEMLVRQNEPEVFISRQRCNLCQWFKSCNQIAHSQQHLSLIAGVTPNRYQHLQAMGIHSIEALAAAHPLLMAPYIDRAIASQLVTQAQSTLYNRPIIKSLPLPDDLPVAPIELYFDIEAEPEQNFDYLLGVLVVDRIAQTQTFYPLLAEQLEDEGANWQQFLALVNRYPDAPIFHFCDYEVKAVRQLAKRYHTPYARLAPILDRFVDIHERVTRLVTLPVEGYALKAIARWLGFEWQESSANGAQCIYWFDCWLKTGDRTFLDFIIRYNEDDCRATYRVKDWLVNYFSSSL